MKLIHLPYQEGRQDVHTLPAFLQEQPATCWHCGFYICVQHTQIEDQLGQATRTSCRTGSLISLLNADCAILCILFTCYTNKGCFWLLTVQKCEILCLTSFAGIMKWQSCEANCSMLLCMLLICMVMTVRIC